ncbi:MurR/RpiR family transcriptional regulator [Erwinia sorbitola]|uniref:SIS domain-containing protein n=1 Tax=Erwinia sorbitola TaxID=2681984 RepID=A0A6I6ECM6_9GAMM|nr:MurR/RpiR family transcriptional regulator [Erwinia sorbitola]QGU87547.1 SIS domain-containing protein [Erwinia sorbitola]
MASRKETTNNSSPPHRNYEQVVNDITERYPQLSDRFQQVARFITQNPNAVALESINAIAARCELHPSTLVRFAQHFGYSGFKQMQSVFQTRLATTAPGYNERIVALENDLQKNEKQGSLGFLQNLVVRDIATLQGMLEGIAASDLDSSAQLLSRAETIFIAGQLRSEPVAILLRYLLTMLNRKVILLDTPGGLAPHMAMNMTQRDVLVAVSFRHYAQEVVNISEIAEQKGVPTIAITDSVLSPLARNASVLFTIPEEEYSFSRSLAAPVCLVQCMALALAAALHPEEEQPRIETLTERTQRSAAK